MKVPILLCLTVIGLCAPVSAQRWSPVYAQPGPLANYTLTLEANPGISGPYPHHAGRMNRNKKPAERAGGITYEMTYS